MFKLGETVRLTWNHPVPDVQQNCVTFLHEGDLVRVCEIIGTRFIRIETADGLRSVVPYTALKADDSLPLFSDYRPETTGCLF